MTLDSEILEAVALRYRPEDSGQSAPILAAKGRGNVARRIIEVAQESEIPMHRDSDLVGLLMKLDLDSEVPPELYDAVAEVFSFVYNVNERFKQAMDQTALDGKNGRNK